MVIRPLVRESSTTPERLWEAHPADTARTSRNANAHRDPFGPWQTRTPKPLEFRKRSRALSIKACLTLYFRPSVCHRVKLESATLGGRRGGVKPGSSQGSQGSVKTLIVSGTVVRQVRSPTAFGGRNRAAGGRTVFKRSAEARRCLGGGPRRVLPSSATAAPARRLRPVSHGPMTASTAATSIRCRNRRRVGSLGARSGWCADGAGSAAVRVARGCTAGPTAPAPPGCPRRTPSPPPRSRAGSACGAAARGAMTGAGIPRPIDERLRQHNRVPPTRSRSADRRREHNPNTRDARLYTETPDRIRRRALLATSGKRCQATVGCQPIHAARGQHRNAAAVHTSSASQRPSASATYANDSPATPRNPRSWCARGSALNGAISRRSRGRTATRRSASSSGNWEDSDIRPNR